MYKMKPEYLLGIKVIDEQHTMLFDLTDQAYRLLKDDNILYKDEKLAKIILGIEEFAQKHFDEEEAYMEKSGYAAIEEHRELHRIFSKKVREFERSVKDLSLETQDDIILSLLDYLVLWLEKHIYVEDRKYTRH